MASSLATVLKMIVLPAVEEVLRPDEPEALHVLIGSSSRGVPAWIVQLSCRGEPFSLELGFADLAEDGISAATERFRDSLQDFVAESSFGWGERR